MRVLTQNIVYGIQNEIESGMSVSFGSIYKITCRVGVVYHDDYKKLILMSIQQEYVMYPELLYLFLLPFYK